MTLFIISAFLILLTTLFLLVRPLLKSRNTISYERQAQNIHYAKERLEELDEQLKNASISATDYEALKLEIESNLASDIDLAKRAQTDPKVMPRRSNKVMISLLSVLLPLTVIGLYWLTGTPSALNQTAAPERPSSEDFSTMLADLEKRLAANPTDVQGWTILSRTYLAQGRYREARDGFLKLVELEGESAELLSSLADASALIAGGDMAGEPTQYIERALKLEPNSPQALWLAGVSAIQKNQVAQAREYWNKLLPLLAGSPKQQEELKVIIKQTFNGPSTLSSEAGSVPGATVTNSETDEGNESSDSELNVSVSIDPTMLESVSANDLVFIFARAETGPPAPLAVKRLTVADLPTTVALSDADAMMPQLKMSLFDNVVITARVAKSGNPVAQSGDIQSEPVVTKSNSPEAITLVINTLID